MPKLAGDRLPKKRCVNRGSLSYALVTLNGKDHVLGHWGSKEADEKYVRLTADWQNRSRLPPTPVAIEASARCTIEELVAHFWTRKVCSETRKYSDSERQNYRQMLRPLVLLYGTTPAADFAEPQVEAWLAAVTDPKKRKLTDYRDGSKAEVGGWARTNANKHLSRLKALFKWGSKNKLVPKSVYHDINDIEGLQAGRTNARETEAVNPVRWAALTATLPFLSRHIRAMVTVQLLTGMRSSELCRLRVGSIDMTDPVNWVYRPSSHKTRHKNRTREIDLTPPAQEILRDFLGLNIDAYIFRPEEAESERLAELHSKRKTPLNEGNRPGTNRVESPKRKPGDHYTRDSYRHAIIRGADRADAWAKGGKIIGNNQRLIERWHPHQLRHSCATEARKMAGTEAAQVLLGHSKLNTTEIYAEKDAESRRRHAAQLQVALTAMLA